MRKKPHTAATPSGESQEFRAAVRDAKPLAQQSVPKGLAPRKPPPRRRRAAPRAAAAQDFAPSEQHGPPPLPERQVGAEDRLSFKRGGVQDQRLRKLRRGLMPIEADLDLHGMTQREAWDMLEEFLRRSRERGLNCVRIVHGKGHRSTGPGPVLKTALDGWLRHRHDVIAFVSARPIDGGAGALYVLLRG